MMLLLNRQAWLHSLKCFLAALLALYIALAAQLPRPYWAMLTAYIVMQPIMGGTHSRGIYRILGTFIATAAVLVIVPPLAQSPTMMSLALSLWLAACVFIALLHRGPASYVFFLAGYTTAIIAFSAIADLENLFSIALSRCEEITTGAVCAVLVSTVVFPVSIQPQIRQRVDALVGDAKTWCLQALAHQSDSAALRQRMVGALTQLDAILPFAGRDDTKHGELDEWLHELRACLLGLLPILASIEDRLGQLHDAHDAFTQDTELSALLEHLRAWIGKDELPTQPALAGFRQRIAALHAGGGKDEPGLLRESLLLRLDEWACLWLDCRQLQHAIVTGVPPQTAGYGLDLKKMIHVGTRHHDWSMMAWSALTAGAIVFSYYLLLIALGWQDGLAGASMVAIMAALFAAQDDPAQAIDLGVSMNVLTFVLAGIYLFGILPLVHDFLPLALVLAPFFLPVGLLIFSSRWAMHASLQLMGMCMSLSLENGVQVEFARFASSMTAMVLGMIYVLVMTRVCRSVSAQWRARRLVRQGWQLLADAAEGHGQQDRDRLMLRLLDLLGLLVPRMAVLPKDDPIVAVDILDEARIGLNILNLRRARHHLPAAMRETVDSLIAALAAHYRAQQRHARPLPLPDTLKARPQALLPALRDLPPSHHRDEALLGLVGLRYLFKAMSRP